MISGDSGGYPLRLVGLPSNYTGCWHWRGYDINLHNQFPLFSANTYKVVQNCS